MDRVKYLEEQLREASCLGDFEAVCELVSKGIDINAQHDMNGWTALHWAAKRGQKDIVSYLLKHGADKSLLTSKEETPLALATKPEVRILLGGEPGVTINTADLPIVPNYIKNEPLDPRVNDYQVSNQNRTHQTNPVTANQNVVTTSHHSIVNHSTTNTPAQLDELVLKVRIAQDMDDDFIEIELNRLTELTYYSLLNICCKELNIDSPQTILKIRKLPNTIIRKDKDVARLTMFQEIELVLSQMPDGHGSIVNGMENTHLNSARLPFSAKGVNNYPSIHKYKNQTILY
ncbi:ankyrin repeat domain-containing protein 40-like [Diaphorina citri]|uniref:Ankyrin repeat domain-containing protein 40-like n=1 Tax=Diaphorina citri TaxID=121845 RepID=A0A1S3D358_DIACI|nr:ankyrin repeat domain-containing protein 40-like [Diaphorina citri]